MELPQIVVSVSIAIFFCFIGIPVWWQTTKVYRANLPFGELNSLAKSVALKVKSRWNIFVDQEIFQNNSKYIAELKDAFDLAVKYRLVSYHVESNLSFLEKINADLRYLIETFDGTPEKAYTLSNLVEELIGNEGESEGLLQQNVLFTRGNNSFSGHNECHLILGTTNLIALLNDADFKSDHLQKCMEKIALDFNGFYPEIKFNLTNKDALENMSKIAPTHSATGLEIAFSLANANPFDFTVDWNIKEAIEDNLKPFLKELAFFGPYVVTSQVLNFVDVGISPKKSKKEGYFYTKKMLPLLINPLQTRLSEYTSNNPILNFILYVPPNSDMPLKIRNKGNNHKAFLSPRWGGVVIKNIDLDSIDTSENETVRHVDIDVKEDMKMFVLQFRELVGLSYKATKGRTVSAFDRRGVMKWEVYHLLLSETVSNLKKSTSTLVSLTELLEKISNIVIRDDIKELIEAAVSNITDSKNFLEDGQIEKSFNSSRAAVFNSEKAFYDHSLLALLYFPDDQKYAIYLPLFLPIGIPVILSFVYAIKSIIDSKKKPKSE